MAERAVTRKELLHSVWRDESIDLTTLNLHCIQLDVYRDAEGWHLECRGLSISHMSLPRDCDTMPKAKTEALARVSSKLTHLAQLAASLASPSPVVKSTP